MSNHQVTIDQLHCSAPLVNSTKILGKRLTEWAEDHALLQPNLV